jgi:putative heme transporter
VPTEELKETIVVDDPGQPAQDTGGDGDSSQPKAGSGPLAKVPRVGIWAWSFVGFVAATIIVVTALSAVSEIMLPLLFAVVLAVIFKPLVGKMQNRGMKPSLAAGLVVLGLMALMIVVLIGTVRGITDQTAEIGASVDAAIANASDDLGVDQASLDEARAATQDAAPAIAEGFLTKLIAGVGSLVGLASGLILGALIMYYMLKDGAKLRAAVVAQVDASIRGEIDDFIGDSCRILRDYGRGRTIMSGIVSVVIGLTALLMGLPIVFTIMVTNFIGGYIPYIGAFLGGGLAVIVALGDGGLGAGLLMLVVVLAANLLLENFVEPKVMSRTLDIHPLVVLVVTALGGFLAGIVGLILAVPFTVIAANFIGRLRRRGILDVVAEKAEPTVKSMLT